jgi:multicomponent Na+:H+ antiporter subunit F
MIAAMVLLLTAAAALGILRFLRGPGDTDRVVALDILFAAAIGLCVAAALASGRVLFLDVAIGLSLVGFVATVAWARMIDRRGRDAQRGEDPE